jgi:uncharacterized protein YhaN
LRLDELVLERYGAYEHRRLTLAGPGLTVVHGPNEAGKSTCLAAIGDFLFRVPERSPRGGVFGGDQMRIGATLTTADGRTLTFKRRAGRGRTLIDEAGGPSDEAPLAALLGATTRDRFEHLFGLDHEGLREGGEQLLRADGEIGRLIVEAGGGLRSLMSRLAAVDDEIKLLFTPTRSSSRLFYKALDAFDAADAAAREATLTRDAYERDRKAYETASATLAEARSDRHEFAEAMSRLRRAERVIPVLRAHEEAQAAAAGFADVGSLPADWSDRWAAALAGRRAAAEAEVAARGRLQALSARLAALVVDEGIVAADAALRDIEARVVQVTAERRDRANRLKELGAAEAQLSALRDHLGLSPADDLEAMAPSATDLAAVRDLAAQALARRPRLRAARDAIQAGETTVHATQARLAALASANRDQPFGIDAARFLTLPADARGARAAKSRAEGDLALQTSRAQALHPGGLLALRDLAFPTLDHLRQEMRAREDLAAEAARQTLARAGAAREWGAATADIERLEAGGEIATAQVVAQARERRDALLAPIRQDHLAGASGEPPDRRGRQVAALDGAIAEADRLSDARVTEAGRVAGLLEAVRRRDAAAAAVKAAEDAGRDLSQALEGRVAALSAAFPEACASWPEAAALLAATDTRIDILARAEAARAGVLDADGALERLAPSLRELALAEARAGLPARDGEDLTVRTGALARAIAVHDREHADHERERRALAVQEAALVAARGTLAALEREESAWRTAWEKTAASIAGLAPDASPEAADALAVQWTGARGDLRSLANTRRRLIRMDEDEAELAARIGAVGAALALALPADPLAAGRLLAERRRVNEDARVARDTLAPDLAQARATVDAAADALSRTEADLAALAAVAGEPLDEAALERLAVRRRGLAEVDARLSNLLAQAGVAGDGLPIAKLRDEVSGRDLDAVRADIADLQDRIDTAENAIERANREIQQAADALAVHEGPSARARAVIDRERAAAEMAAAAEHWVELKLARHLIGRAIAKVRGEQQDPLIKAAGALFARMTQGRFEGVAADVDAKGAPVVVGVRRGGAGQAVATLSDGTRDQLFLAFRLASLAHYCAAAEPLPFIADDILVHFDDARSAATLELLADFSATTQVILFTHHLSVRRAAEPMAAAGRATLLDL